MFNYAIYYGEPGFYDDYKLTMLDYFPKEWNISIISRSERNSDIPGTWVNLLDHPIFNGSLDPEVVRKEEKWINGSFTNILESNYYWKYFWKHDKNKKKDDFYEFFAKCIISWRDFFLKNNIEFFTTTLECAFLENIGQKVSSRLGIKNVNLSSAPLSNTFRLVDNSFLPL
ncbi:hypothetical protein JXB01_02165, partial [Candidatus Micrarchaeota archaeon]|nr:hypothetical protein [Candidatus Micrarchaeota archaeon]